MKLMKKSERILLAHGSGGKLSRQLVEEVILPGIGVAGAVNLDDAAVLQLHGMAGRAKGPRLAFTTDSYVVSPIFFPGGNIGDLAINGTVNDLAMMGARPGFVTVGLVIEEGFALDELEAALLSMRKRALEAGVTIVAGDTKVVERGKADRIFISTSGIGLIPDGREVSGSLLQPGDRILVSGTIGDHGMAVLSQREGLEFRSDIVSDSAPLNSLVEEIFETGAEIHALRDPTRGGLAATLNEFATGSGVGILVEESAVPLEPSVSRACDLLGLDPFYVANEGKLVVSVSETGAEQVLQAMQGHPQGGRAAAIGTASSDHSGTVILQTRVGGKRILDMPTGEQLPRIC